MNLHLEILPPAQTQLWTQLGCVPKDFVLYGGTAIALQLGHRESVDFDFFSSIPLNKDKLLSEVTFLKDAHVVMPELNTINAVVETEKGSVKFQFLSGIDKRQGRVESPIYIEENGIYLASLRDLFATKLNTIQARAAIKDYIDIDALLQYGISLEDGLGCAQAIWGPQFDPGTSLRALCSFKDGDLLELSQAVRDRLIKAATTVEDVPRVDPQSFYLSPIME